jgi:hypothetical protein
MGAPQGGVDISAHAVANLQRSIQEFDSLIGEGED